MNYSEISSTHLARPTSNKIFMFKMCASVLLQSGVSSYSTQIGLWHVPYVLVIMCVTAFGTSGMSHVCKAAPEGDLSAKMHSGRCRKCPVLLLCHGIAKGEERKFKRHSFSYKGFNCHKPLNSTPFSGHRCPHGDNLMRG